MRGEPGVIDYLNKALRHELTAVNQYWLHYRLLDNWGYKALAKQWRKESIEEMQHADKLIERIIFLDGFPNMQVLDPLHIGQNVKEVLDCDLAAEISARTLYEEAATHCHAVQGLRVARPVREADARRGRAHRLPRNPARPRRQARARALRPASHRRTRRGRRTDRRRGSFGGSSSGTVTIVNKILTGRCRRCGGGRCRATDRCSQSWRQPVNDHG